MPSLPSAFQCAQCALPLLTHSYSESQDQISCAELICSSCGCATPIIYGLYLFPDTASGPRGEHSLHQLADTLFDSKRSFRKFIKQQIHRPIFDAYAAYTPFNEALLGFIRFRELIAAELNPGDVILDLSSRTGWCGEFLAALFPQQKVISRWEGNRGVLGYRGYGYWLNEKKRLSNLDYIFVDDTTHLPLANGSVNFLFAYDYLHHHVQNTEMDELSRILDPTGNAYFPHVHTNDGEPDPWFERGGTILSAENWRSMWREFKNLGTRTPFVLGELACFGDDPLILDENAASDDYNFAAFVGPFSWQNLELPLAEPQLIDKEALILLNPLLDINLTTGNVSLRPENMAGGAQHLLTRHPEIETFLLDQTRQPLNSLQKLILYWAEKGLKWWQILGKCPAAANLAEIALNNLISRYIILALPVSESMWRLQQFYHRRQLVQPINQHVFSTLWQDLQENYSDSPVLIDSDGSEFGVADSELLVNATTQLLHKLNLKRGDAILILTNGHLEAFIATWAAWLRGIVVVVLNREFETSQLNQIIADFEIKLIFIDQMSQMDGGLNFDSSQAEIILFDDMQSSVVHPELFSARVEPHFNLPGAFTDKIHETDAALILATSGSSGAPKQVVLSHGALFRSGASLAQSYAWLPGERLLSLGPFYSMSGLRNPAVAALHSGTTIVIASLAQQNSFPATLNLIEKSKVGIVSTVPAFIENLLAFQARGDLPDFPALRLILSTASKLDASLREELSTDISADIADYYGLTETCGICVMQAPGSKPQINSIGHASNALVEVRDSAGEILAIGKKGELHIYSDNLMTGYLGEPESGLTMDNGWLATGDLAQITDTGEILLLGRLDKARKNRRGEFIRQDTTAP